MSELTEREKLLGYLKKVSADLYETRERLRKLEMFSSGVLTECGCHRPPRYEPTPIVDSDFVPTGCIRQPVIRLSVLVGAWSR